MGFCGEVGSDHGYDSKVPIQQILNYFEHNFDTYGNSVGYGEFSAHVSCSFNSYYRQNSSFFRRIKRCFLPEKVSFKKMLKEIKFILAYYNKPNILVTLKGSEFQFKYLKEDEYKTFLKTKDLKRKINNFK
jgi:hypothetical protein